MGERKARILVLGAGVSGLTAAHVLLERGHHVVLWTRDDPLETTSSVAAALWWPFEAGPPERVAPWAIRAYAAFRRLAARPGTGVVLRELVGLCSPAREIPTWLAALEGYRPLAGAERRGYEQGWSARAPVIEMPRYLPWLVARVRELGGVIERRSVRSFAETEGFDAVVNCTGLGARELCGDEQCFPIRGQLVRVARGTLERSLLFQNSDGSFGYLIPRSGDCVLGGTAERGATSLAPDAAQTEEILARCRAFEPGLDARGASVVVGLRPGREAIRLARERLADGRALIHDYGHGGCGVTLSWGCAEEVLGLVEETLA